jgi:hypothetical protein
MEGRLDDRILLCMKSPAEFMALARGDLHALTQTADIKTVPEPGRRTIISGSKQTAVPDEHGADTPP